MLVFRIAVLPDVGSFESVSGDRGEQRWIQGGVNGSTTLGAEPRGCLRALQL